MKNMIGGINMISITFIASFFAIFIFIIIGLIDLPLDGWECTKRQFKRASISALVCVLSFLALCPLAMKLYTEKIETARYELVSLQDNTQISGHARGGLFYLYASVDTDDVYTFYYTHNGGYKKGKIVSENITIYEDDNHTPCIIEYTTAEKLDMNPILKAILTFGMLENSEVSYEVFVPKGTIVPAFSLDAQ